MLLLDSGTDVRYEQSRITIIPVTLPLPLPVLASRSSIGSIFVLQVGHNAMLFKIINIKSFKKLFEVLVTFLQLLEEFLCMTTSLSGRSSSDVLLHFPPFFTVELKRYQESEVLVLGPATHAVLVLHITLLVLIALTLEVGMASSVPGGITTATSQILSKSLVRNCATPNFARR